MSDKKLEAEKSVFNRLSEYEIFRYNRRGIFNNILSISMLVGFFYVANILKDYWPKEQLDEGKWYFWGILILHSGCFVFFNFLMYLIYMAELPYFEQFKTYTENWPWKQNPEEWSKLWDRTKKGLIINQCIIFPLAISPHYILGNSPMAVQFEDLPDLKTIIIQILFFLIVEDLSFYLMHRLMHHPAIYKYFHKVHHEHKFVIGIVSEYTHPVDFLFSNLLTSSLGSLILGRGCHLYTYLVWLFLRVWETTDGHCGYEFPWSPFRLLPLSAGEDYHNHHHLYYDGNYGSFLTIWDRFFNTTNDQFKRFINRKYEEKPTEKVEKSE